jgi:two-component system, sensor histidine kinase ChiS
MPRPSILVVEDHAATREALVRMLQHEGFVADGVATSMECLKVMDQGETFDLLIIDVVMPSSSGFSLGRMARQRRPINDFSISAATAMRFQRMSSRVQARQCLQSRSA